MTSTKARSNQISGAEGARGDVVGGMTSPPPTWHTLTPSRRHTEEWIESLYETMATHRSLMDAHTVDFFTSSHWENVVPEMWRSELEQQPDMITDDFRTKSSSSTTHGSLGHFLHTVRSQSIPVAWNQSGVWGHPNTHSPDHLARFGMTAKKSHEVHNFSQFIAQLTTKLNIGQVMDIGSGKGYLSQHLALCERLCVVGIDSQLSNTLGACSRNKKVQKAWKCLSQAQDKSYSQPPLPTKIPTGQGTSLQARPSDCSEVSASSSNSSSERETERDECIKETPLTSGGGELDQQRPYKPAGAVFDISSSSETEKEVKSSLSDIEPLREALPLQTESLSYTALTHTLSAASVSRTTDSVTPEVGCSLLCEAERESGGRFVGQKPTCIVGLHTCGDLGGVVLKLFLRQPQLRAVCVVGCCYHHITEADDKSCSDDVGFPMSSFLRSRRAYIGRTGRMLACQGSSRISLISSGAALESVFRRAVLQVILQRRYPDIFEKRGKTLIVGRMRKPPERFEDYVKQALERIGLQSDSVSTQESAATYREFEPQKRHLSIHLKLRAVLASCVESLILLDRFLFLKEQDITEHVSLVQLFNPVESPRCFAVVATRQI